MPVQLRACIAALTQHFKYLGDSEADQIEKNIIGFGLFASVASAAAGAISGVGPVATVAVTTACVYALYYKLTKIIGIEISKNCLKSIASAVLANLVSNVGVSIVAAVAVSFIPFFGNLSSSAICAITQFASVYVSGFVFITTLNALIEKFGGIPTSENSFDQAVKDVNEDIDVNELVNEAKKVHKEVKNDKEYKKDLTEIEKLVNDAKKDMDEKDKAI